MSVTRSLSQGLTPFILVAVLVTVVAAGVRISAVRKAAAEQLRERESIATIRAQREDFEVTVEGIGALEAVRSTPVLAEVNGQLVYVITNGVEVREGDIIAELDVPRMERQLRQQELDYERALADYAARERDLEASVIRARLSLEQAQHELERFLATQEADLTDRRSQRDHDAHALSLTQERFERKSRLQGEGLVTQQELELDTAQIKSQEFNVERQAKELEVAEARRSSEQLDREDAVKRAESDLERALSAQQDELRNAMMTVRIREQQLARVREQFERAVIRAPASGIVVLAQNAQGMTQRTLEPGDQVWSGRPVATIPDLSQMRAVLDVSQAQVRLVERRQQARVRAEALPGIVFEGLVEEVAQTGSEGRFQGTGIPTGERTFRTAILIEDTQGAAVRPGMTAHVEVVVQQVPDAVSIPRACVFERDDRRVVYVRRDEGFAEVEVELGPESDDEVVITAGLEGGEEVALRDLGARAEEGTGGEELAPELPL